MKVPPGNNLNGFNSYDEEHYFNENAPTITAPVNGNGTVDDYAPMPPVEDTDFSEYMWMENEEEFDKEVLQRLEEEELMEQCMLQHMLDDDRQQPASNNSNSNNANQHKAEPAEMAKSSTLNPHAAEFVPSWSRTPVPEQKSS